MNASTPGLKSDFPSDIADYAECQHDVYIEHVVVDGICADNAQEKNERSQNGNRQTRDEFRYDFSEEDPQRENENIRQDEGKYKRVCDFTVYGEQIRTAATLHHVSCVTTIDAALAAAQGMAERHDDEIGVRSLQEYHGRTDARDAAG